MFQFYLIAKCIAALTVNNQKDVQIVITQFVEESSTSFSTFLISSMKILKNKNQVILFVF